MLRALCGQNGTEIKQGKLYSTKLGIHVRISMFLRAITSHKVFPSAYLAVCTSKADPRHDYRIMGEGSFTSISRSVFGKTSNVAFEFYCGSTVQLNGPGKVGASSLLLCVHINVMIS